MRHFLEADVWTPSHSAAQAVSMTDSTELISSFSMFHDAVHIRSAETHIKIEDARDPNIHREPKHFSTSITYDVYPRYPECSFSPKEHPGS